MPSSWLYYWATSLVLFPLTMLCSSSLFLNIHFVPIVEHFLGLETNFQTWFCSKLFNSSCIAKYLNSSTVLHLHFLGSSWDKKARLPHSLWAWALVLTLLDASLIVYSVEWSLMNLQAMGKSWWESIFSCCWGGWWSSPSLLESSMCNFVQSIQ